MQGNVDERQAAEQVIMQSVRGLYFFAGTELVGGLLGMLFILNGVLSAILGFWLGRSRSRLAAATTLASSRDFERRVAGMTK